MYPYIRCFCGRSIGDIYDLFKAMRLEKYKAHIEKTGAEVTPGAIVFSDDLGIELRDVFEALKISTFCCKTRLLTQVEFSEYY